MKTVYMLTEIEVRVLPGSELSKQDVRAEGAFVTCVIVAAESNEEAKNKAYQALLSDGYRPIGYEGLTEFTAVIWNDEQAEMNGKAMAWDALISDEIGYGEFRYWPIFHAVKKTPVPSKKRKN